MAETVWLALRLVLAVVLLSAAVAKVRDPRRFADEIGRYELLPRPAHWPAAVGLIALEAIAGLLALAGEVAGVLLALGLFAAFSVAVGSALRAGRAIPCGCFGGDEVVSGRALARLGLLGAAAAVALLSAVAGPDRWVGGLDGVLTVTVAAGLLVAGRLLLLLPDVRAAMGHVSAPGGDA